MITYSPTILVLKREQKNVTISVKTERRIALSFSVVSFEKKDGRLVQVLCKKVLTENDGNGGLLINQDTIIDIIENCETKHTNFAINVSAKSTASNYLSGQEEILIPIVDETAQSLLQKPQNATVLGELSQAYQVSDLSCTPTSTFTMTDLHCSITITNLTNTPVLLNFVSSLHEDTFTNKTVYQNVERSSTLLIPREPYALNFIMPKEKYGQGRYTVASDIGISMVGSVASSYTVTKVTSFLYLSPYFAGFLALLGIFLSAILIKFLLKFTTRKRHGTVQKAS